MTTKKETEGKKFFEELYSLIQVEINPQTKNILFHILPIYLSDEFRTQQFFNFV